MGRALGVLAFFVAVGLAAPASAQSWLKPYAAARLAFENPDANQFVFKNGFGGVAAVGVNVKDHFRVEFSASRRGADIIGVPPLRAEGYYRAWAWLLNAYAHPLGIDRPVSPYAGIGFGFNRAAVEAMSAESDPALQGLGFPKQTYYRTAWQGKLGVAVRVTQGAYFDFAGSYFASDDHDIASTFPNNPTVESAYRTYSAVVGVRAEF